MTDYLSDFDGLEYEFEKDGNEVHLSNLKELGGMEVAELLTYLSDDGYMHFGPMVSNEENGFLIMHKPE